MKTQYTPGPWHLGMSANGRMIYGPKGEQIADVSAGMLSPDEDLANAKLMESTPELLEALQEMVALAISLDCKRIQPSCSPFTRKAQAIITKTTA